MKIRQGHVSNSSSSSFVIGIGIVNDKPFLDQEFGDSYKITYHNVGENQDAGNTSITVDSGINGASCSIDITDLDPTDVVVTYESYEHDDDDFWNGDEYDYDKADDIDFFDDFEQHVMSIFNGADNLIRDGEVMFGAGRDG